MPGVSLRQIYEAVHAEAGQAGPARAGGAQREERGGGGGQFGRITLGELCRQEAVPLAEAVQALTELGIEATEATDASRLREVADRLGMAPRELADWLTRDR